MSETHLQIYWFSGSGNTLAAARVLAGRLEELGWTVELLPMENTDAAEVNPDVMLGLAFPTHCFAVPEFVWKWAKRLPRVSGTPAIMLGTHGAASGGVLGPMKHLLTKKGFHCTAGRILSMPDSFFPFTGEKTNHRWRLAAMEKARLYAEAIHAGGTHWGRWPILSDIHGALFGGFFALRKFIPGMYTTVHARPKTCVRCGTCSRQCPVQAISMPTPNAVPCADRRCTNCLRCVAVCPTDAMRHMTGFSPYRSMPAEELTARFGEEMNPNHAPEK